MRLLDSSIVAVTSVPRPALAEARKRNEVIAGSTEEDVEQPMKAVEMMAATAARAAMRKVLVDVVIWPVISSTPCRRG